jgi:hypothetical protein
MRNFPQQGSDPFDSAPYPPNSFAFKSKKKPSGKEGFLKFFYLLGYLNAGSTGTPCRFPPP